MVDRMSGEMARPAQVRSNAARYASRNTEFWWRVNEVPRTFASRGHAPAGMRCRALLYT